MQCGLSGNLVPCPVTVWSNAAKGNRPDGDILVHYWENLLDLKPQCLPGVLPPVLLKYTWLIKGKILRGGGLSLLLLFDLRVGWERTWLMGERIS